MNNQIQNIEENKFMNYEALIELRKISLKSAYPNHPYVFRQIKYTPKAKYSDRKILNNYVFKTELEAINAAKYWIAEIKRNYEKRQLLRAAIKAKNAEVKACDFYKIGDIIINSWGYEQTNVDFFQVIAVKNKTIQVREIGHKIVPGSEYSHGMACNVIPDKNIFLANGKEYLLRVKTDGILSNPASYYYFHKWNGLPEYMSWYY